MISSLHNIKFAVLIVPFYDLSTGEKTSEMRFNKANGYYPIPVTKAGELLPDNISPKVIRTLIAAGTLTPLNSNGTIRRKKGKQGRGNPLCFCLEEWLNLHKKKSLPVPRKRPIQTHTPHNDVR